MLKSVFFCRGIVAILFGFMATLFAGCCGTLLGLLFRLTRPKGDMVWKNPARHVVSVWAYFCQRVCVETVLGVRLHLLGKLAPADQSELILCIGNHPSTLTAATVAWFITRYLSDDLCVVAKKEHRFNPVGWILWVLDAAIFIDRSNGMATSECIAMGTATVSRPGAVIILFPDAHRPSKERIDIDRDRFREKIDDLDRWPRETLVPRGGALAAFLLQFPEKRFRVVDLTIACSHDDSSLLASCFLTGSDLYLSVQDRSLRTMKRDRLDMWLNDTWRRKNFQIAQWKRV